MRYLFSLFILLITTTVAFSQVNGYNDTAALKLKLKAYSLRLQDAKMYHEKMAAEVEKVNFFNSEARVLYDSANKALDKARFDTQNSKMYLTQYDMLYKMSSVIATKADSCFKVAQRYKDTSTVLTIQADAYYKTISAEYNKVLMTDTTSTATATSTSAEYTVQLGAGNMKENYFEKVPDIEIITPSDGTHRYISGRFKTKEAANAYKDKMVKLGFTSAYVRTTASLNY